MLRPTLLRRTRERVMLRARRAVGLGPPIGTGWRPVPTRDPAAAPPRIGRVLFICGLHRSGTTAVEHHVRARYEVACLRAPVPESEGQLLQDVYPPAARHGGPGRFAFAPEMHPAPPPAEEAPALRARLLDCWAPYVQGDEPLLSEKSPPNLTKIPYLRAIFPGALFLIVVRDPRAVAGATLKWAGTSLEALVFHWGVAHAAAIRALGPDCHVISYETFCDGPEAAFDVAGLDAALPRRAEALPVHPRFATLDNRNDKYVAMHRCPSYGPGAWEHFGYRI